MILRTDVSLAQLPLTLPDFSKGKNTIVTDASFQTKIVRFTDETDNATSSLMTADSPEAGLWNANDTLLLTRSSGGVFWLYEFNPKKMQRQPVPIGKYSGKACFSRTANAVLYVLEGSVVSKVTFAKVGGLWKEKSRAIVCDFAKILPAGFNINWTSTFLVSQNDALFSAAFSEGVQNTGHLACVWQKGNKKGYRMVNTQTGDVTGQWGELGRLRVNSPDTTLPFTLHAFGATPNPDYAIMGAKDESDSSSMAWHVPTLDVIDQNVSGHRARGWEHVYAGGPGGGQLLEVEYTDATVRRPLLDPKNLPANQVPPQKYDGDAHFGIGAVDVDDDCVVWVSSQSDLNGSPGKEFTSAWMNEVRGYKVKTGEVVRACHTCNSGLQVDEFIAKNAMAVPSQTGRFVAFTSDMMQTLANKRSDVFIVQVAG